jgi:ABC-type sugar transport system ATPase subunit
MTPLLELKNIHVAYPSANDAGAPVSRKPLDGLNFSMFPGELVVILGDSGTGKTTLLNVIAGFLRPRWQDDYSDASHQGSVRRLLFGLGQLLLAGDRRTTVSGRVLIAGQDVSHIEPRRRDIGLVMQRFSLYDHMTIEDNLRFPLNMSGLPRNEFQEFIADVVNRLEIDHSLLNKFPRQLSDGQQQRVAIAKVLLRRPKVALFDEAFSHLDYWLRKKLRGHVIRHLLHETRADGTKCGVVFVSHNLEDAHQADRIIYFEKTDRDDKDSHEVKIHFFPEELPTGASKGADSDNPPLVSALESSGQGSNGKTKGSRAWQEFAEKIQYETIQLIAPEEMRQ